MFVRTETRMEEHDGIIYRVVRYLDEYGRVLTREVIPSYDQTVTISSGTSMWPGATTRVYYTTPTAKICDHTDKEHLKSYYRYRLKFYYLKQKSKPPEGECIFCLYKRIFN